MNSVGAQTSGTVRPRPLKWHQRWAATGIYGLLRGAAMTVRFRVEDQTEGIHRREPVIFCVWHDRLALSLELWRRFGDPSPRGMAAMVSASKDGGIVARVLEHFGVQPVRGSTSRRGRQALLELTTWAQRGLDLAITPDGPRGPRHVVQPGVLYLAQLTGLSIIPVSCSLSRKITLNSWDRFLVPLPFGTCSGVFHRSVRIPRQAEENRVNEARQYLQTALGD